MKSALNIATLPFRLLLSLVATPFAIQKHVVARIVAVLAIFGFWEIFNSIAKEPITLMFQAKTQEYQAETHAMRRARTEGKEWLSSDVLFSNYRAAKWVIGAEWRAIQAGLGDDGTRLAQESRLDFFMRQMSRSIDKEIETATAYNLATVDTMWGNRPPRYSDKRPVYPEQIELEEIEAGKRRAAEAERRRELAAEQEKRRQAVEAYWQFQQKLASFDASRRETVARGSWTDPDTGLVWTATDSHQASWNAALAYCQALTLGGQSDWRLPSLSELEAIYAPPLDMNHGDGFKGGIRSKGLEWSSTKAGNGKAWYVNASAHQEGTAITADGPHYFEAGASPDRALCARSGPNNAIPPTRFRAGEKPVSPVSNDGFDTPVVVNSNSHVAFYPVSDAEKARIKARNYKREETGTSQQLAAQTSVRRILSPYGDAFSVSFPDGAMSWLVSVDGQPGLVRLDDYRNTHPKN